MKKIFLCFLILFLNDGIRALAQATDNEELKQMYDADQAARLSGEPIDWSVLNREDSLRLVRVNILMKEDRLVTGKDYYHAAMIFQHGDDTMASALAVSHMQKAIALDSTVNKWLLAAAIDRDLMRRNKPQIYGTQFIQMGKDAQWERYKIDTTQITDQERIAYNVETLAQQEQKEWLMNQQRFSEYYQKTGSIEKTIAFIRKQHQNGRLSAFSIEEELNIFGYELLSKNKNEEALKIFKLNTELYPESFNVYDSYGECLMKMGDKKKGIKAYKKSLTLNAQNENARQIIEETQK